ncbi:SRPBCC family protein [Micromonospora sp. KLBMP9576]|uniref:SRPBCC family protein n=1 Tax=Micromonospora sp. KLBMP9576 TaxID=3424769 RepID=UPI003D8CB543
MSTVAVSQFVQAHDVDLWRLLTDLTTRTRRFAGPVQVLTDGRFGPGTAWRETRSLPDGTALVEEFVVLETEPPRRLVLGSRGAGVDYRITWTLRPVERRRRGCTAVTVAQQAMPTAAYSRVIALLFGGLAARAVERALRQDLADLAAAATAGAAEAA